MPSCSWLRSKYFPAEVPCFAGLVGRLFKYIESQHDGSIVQFANPTFWHLASDSIGKIRMIISLFFGMSLKYSELNCCETVSDNHDIRRSGCHGNKHPVQIIIPQVKEAGLKTTMSSYTAWTIQPTTQERRRVATYCFPPLHQQWIAMNSLLIWDLVLAITERQYFIFECILSLLQAARNTDHHQWLLLGHASCTRAAANWKSMCTTA